MEGIATRPRFEASRLKVGPRQGLREVAWGDVVLIVVFAIVTGRILSPYLALPWAIGGDARIYLEAAGIWLSGGDPWSGEAGGVVTFGAPPHALLFFAPTITLPPFVVGVAWSLGLLLVSAVAIRRLGIPLWWLAFPPLSSAILVGSLDALIFAVLVLGPRWLAPIAKPYAALPLLGDRRYKDLAIAAVIGIGLLAVLPWRQFVAHLPDIAVVLARQASDLSVSGEALAMVVGAVALASLGWRRALWLVTPVLWPSTQLHYAAMTIPALTRATALFLALPIPGAPLVAVVAAAMVGRVAPQLDPEVVVPAEAGSPASSALPNPAA